MDAPAVAVSADGKQIAVAWMDMRRGGNERDVFWRLIQNGKPGPAEALGTDSEGPQGHVALAIDPKGIMHAVWESNGTILYRTSKEREAKGVSTQSRATEPSLAWGGDLLLVAYEHNGGASVRRLNP